MSMFTGCDAFTAKPPKRRNPGSALWTAAAITAFLTLASSSFWLLAVDTAGRFESKRWANGDRVEREGWLHTLALADPRTVVKAGSQCMATAENRQTCRSYFERALRGNRRLAEAEMALILIAEERRDLMEADRLLRDLKRKNRSFAALWLEWNFQLRNGPPERFRSGGREILETAPARFRGDFPLLPLTGMSGDEIAKAMLRRGQSERALDFAAYLSANEDSRPGDLLLRLLSRAGRTPARETALRFIAERLERRHGLRFAARVWAESLRQGLIGDHRRSRDDNPILNPNPRLRMPFVPRSFDWSAAENRWATVVSRGGEGVQIEVHDGAPEGLPLLSKLLLLPEDTTGVRVRMRSGLPVPSFAVDRDEGRRVVWQIYDAQTDRVVVRSPGERTIPVEGQVVFELPLNGVAHSGTVFASLAVGPSGTESREPWELAVTEVAFEVLH
ncbi:MAG: hypothetical protein IT169_15585 [Bryobacterales bacterium]|nr:hypothetical protein [Bryobacterales bacterium]